LLVLDDSLEEPTDSNSLLLPFGLSFGDPLRQPLLRLDGIAGYGSERTVLLPSARSVRGGEAFLATVDGQALGSVVDFGAGRVAAVGVGRSFSVDRLGMTDSVPDPTQLALAEIEYHLFREVLCVSPAASSGSSRDLGARNAR